MLSGVAPISLGAGLVLRLLTAVTSCERTRVEIGKKASSTFETTPGLHGHRRKSVFGRYRAGGAISLCHVIIGHRGKTRSTRSGETSMRVMVLVLALLAASAARQRRALRTGPLLADGCGNTMSGS